MTVCRQGKPSHFAQGVIDANNLRHAWLFEAWLVTWGDWWWFYVWLTIWGIIGNWVWLIVCGIIGDCDDWWNHLRNAEWAISPLPSPANWISDKPTFRRILFLLVASFWCQFQETFDWLNQTFGLRGGVNYCPCKLCNFKNISRQLSFLTLVGSVIRVWFSD